MSNTTEAELLKILGEGNKTTRSFVDWLEEHVDSYTLRMGEWLYLDENESGIRFIPYIDKELDEQTDETKEKILKMMTHVLEK